MVVNKKNLKKEGVKSYKQAKAKDNLLTRGKNCDCETKTSCGAGAIYGLGFIGAAIYYISSATTFWIGVLGILKAFVWPVFLVLKLLRYLGA